MRYWINLEGNTKPLLFVLFLFLWSCTDNVDPVQNEYLVNVELVQTLSVDDLKKSFGNSQASSFSLFIKSGIEKYKVTYKTKDPLGNTVEASGAFILPKDLSGSLPLTSYQHGTLFNFEDAPSNFKQGSEADVAALMAATGTMMAVPDYLGYGVSQNLQHPYEHKEGLAQPVVDYLFAIKELIKSKKISWNNRTLLTGYSEGGYTTMATLQKLEEKHPGTFNIVGVTCGAGAYDKTGTFRQFLTEGTSGEATNNRSYIWVLLTYKEIYKLPIEIKDVFKQPYATEIEKSGFRTLINQSISTIVRDDFKADFLAGKYPELNKAISENDIFDWKPQSELKLFHGTADTYVPVENSIKAFNAMKKNGAQKLEYIPLEGKNHGTAVGDYFLQTFAFFNLNFNPS